MLERLLTYLADRRVRSRRRGGSVGQRGEQLAEDHLRRLGCRVLHRNMRVGRDEVDLVVDDAGVTVFVEVKATLDPVKRPEDEVGYRKRQRLLRAARRHMAARPAGSPWRVDVVAVVLANPPIVRHHRDAFHAA